MNTKDLMKKIYCTPGSWVVKVNPLRQLCQITSIVDWPNDGLGFGAIEDEEEELV